MRRIQGSGASSRKPTSPRSAASRPMTWCQKRSGIPSAPRKTRHVTRTMITATPNNTGYERIQLPRGTLKRSGPGQVATGRRSLRTTRIAVPTSTNRMPAAMMAIFGHAHRLATSGHGRTTRSDVIRHSARFSATSSTAATSGNDARKRPSRESQPTPLAAATTARHARPIADAYRGMKAKSYRMALRSSSRSWRKPRLVACDHSRRIWLALATEPVSSKAIIEVMRSHRCGPPVCAAVKIIGGRITAKATTQSHHGIRRSVKAGLPSPLAAEARDSSREG